MNQVTECLTDNAAGHTGLLAEGLLAGQWLVRSPLASFYAPSQMLSKLVVEGRRCTAVDKENTNAASTINKKKTAPVVPYFFIDLLQICYVIRL